MNYTPYTSGGDDDDLSTLAIIAIIIACLLVLGLICCTVCLGRKMRRQSRAKPRDSSAPSGVEPADGKVVVPAEGDIAPTPRLKLEPISPKAGQVRQAAPSPTIGRPPRTLAPVTGASRTITSIMVEPLSPSNGQGAVPFDPVVAALLAEDTVAEDTDEEDGDAGDETLDI